mgnify:CR=1 FL=1
MSDTRIAELLDLTEAEGITLPYPPDVIVRLEDSGAVVDLVTGAVIVAGADVRYNLTLLGEANAVVWESEVTP